MEKVVGWTCGPESCDHFNPAMVLFVRNVAIATTLAVINLGRLEFAVFAAANFLDQTPLLLAALFFFRSLDSSTS